jgi:hypothetical protein
MEPQGSPDTLTKPYVSPRLQALEQALKEPLAPTLADRREPCAEKTLFEVPSWVVGCNLLCCCMASLERPGNREHTSSNKNSFDLIQGQLVPAPVVKLYRAG